MNEPTTRTGTNPTLTMLLGFIGGALVGTAATLLLAPRSGAETRRRIAERAEHGRDTLERLASAVREGAAAGRTAFTNAMGAATTETTEETTEETARH